ncbi:MAG: carbon-nitrogen hydrolase family protein [Armatimonadota bacterium]|nr:carbon-nitrogen hydrolase family protein [Armatimonadota bacterium]MCX7776955.1 carbon-nitrogen hydrolase family protein [Armatimonadota bacterium]MDW8024789.1 carbon-nitrogen hydrolase family protein [Armatimonadota bacterium]
MARYVRVSTITFGGAHHAAAELKEIVKSNLEAAARLFERAVLDKPDIVALPEVFAFLGVSANQWEQVAETVDGQVVSTFRELARKHNCWVVCPFVERDDIGIRNSAAFIDRNGNVVAKYHKMHPTIDEINAGVIPGTEAVVVGTEFGRIGCAICFDLNFEDVIEGMAQKGVELVFFCSMYLGGLQMRIWAHDYSIFMASSCTSYGSMIVDPLGRVIVTSQPYQPIISRTINLDAVVLHLDYNHTKFAAIKERYGAAIEIDVSSPEAKCVLISHIPDKRASDIVAEFELEPLRSYFERAEKIRKQALAKLNHRRAP